MIDSLMNVCWAEGLKFRRSRAPIMTILASAMIPVAAAILMIASGQAITWPRYFGLLEEATAVGVGSPGTELEFAL